MSTAKQLAKAILLILGCMGLSVGDMELYFERCNCTLLDASGVLQQLNCSLSNAHRQRGTFNMEMEFARDVHKPMVDLRVALPQSSVGAGELVLLNVSRLNACALFVRPKTKDIMSWLRQPLLQYSNLPMRCPLLKQKLYFVRGLRFDASLLPPLPLAATAIEIAFTVLDERLRLFKGVTRLHYGSRAGRRRG